MVTILTTATSPLELPTERGARLFINGLPSPPEWEKEFPLQYWCPKENPWPERAQVVRGLLESDTILPRPSIALGWRLLNYHTTMGRRWRLGQLAIDGILCLAAIIWMVAGTKTRTTWILVTHLVLSIVLLMIALAHGFMVIIAKWLAAMTMEDILRDLRGFLPDRHEVNIQYVALIQPT